MNKRQLTERLADAERETARCRAEAQVAAADATRLREAIDAVPHGVVVCGTTGEIVLRNRHSVTLQGGRHAAALVEQVVEEVVAAAGERPVARTLELHGPPPQTLVVTATPLGPPDEPLGTVVLVDDVSELRRLEAVRRDFVANVSHELRTPVGAMGVLAETLVDETDPAVMQRLAGRITGEAERAARLIDGLLDLSRIEAEGVHDRRRLDVGALVAAAADRVGPLAGRRRVELVVVPASAALAVVGEEGQLISAIANLLGNAIKYSDEASAVEVEVRSAEEWAEIVVHDHGIGIPAKDIERIFERFYRVDRARSRETGGTGLGLAIVRHVAGNHGGEVLVESQEGIGSTFVLRVPAE
ncbi:MAG: ATP-binding protein [Actinomycetota bacterium]|nr:ATP-binding protein [Actinomycetota bacterium]